MKNYAIGPAGIVALAVGTLAFAAGGDRAPQAGSVPTCSASVGCPRKLFVDVHELTPGGVTAEAVAEAHARDLEVQGRYGVEFEKYWVDEQAGLVYCLSSAPDAESVVSTHREAHGLLPSRVHRVTEGQAAALRGNGHLFLDIHRLGPGNVTAEAVAEAHEQDLAVQDAHDVNFVQYWVDETEGVVLCLSEASTPDAVRATHREAHGLLPDRILEVTQGE
jgi:hypothetical protein